MDISSNISVVTIENLIEDFVTIIPADFSLILKVSGLFRETNILAEYVFYRNIRNEKSISKKNVPLPI